MLCFENTRLPAGRQGRPDLRVKFLNSLRSLRTSLLTGAVHLFEIFYFALLIKYLKKGLSVFRKVTPQPELACRKATWLRLFKSDTGKAATKIS